MFTKKSKARSGSSVFARPSKKGLKAFRGVEPEPQQKQSALKKFFKDVLLLVLPALGVFVVGCY